MITGGVVSGNLFWLDRRRAVVEQIISGPFLRSEYLGGLVRTTPLFSLVGVGGSGRERSEPQIAQTGMVVRSASERPAVLSLGLP